MLTLKSPDNASLPHRRLDIEAWAVLMSAWLTFGLSTLLNNIALRLQSDDFTLPTSNQEMLWLVAGIWIAAYLAGSIVGYFHGSLSHGKQIAGSVVTGYLLAISLHLFFLGIFPSTPRDGYGVFIDLIHLRPLPAYYVFLLLVMLLGPCLAALASYTGAIFSQEYSLKLPRMRIEPRIVLFTAIFPLALMLFILGISNWLNMDEAELLQRQARSNREVVPELLILYLDRFINPSINILMAAMIGGLVGLSYIAPNRSISALSAALGLGLYGFAQFILIRLITPNTYYGEFKDALGNLRTPNTLIFTLLWLGPPLVAGLTAFAIHNLRDTYREHPEPYHGNSELSQATE